MTMIKKNYPYKCKVCSKWHRWPGRTSYIYCPVWQRYSDRTGHYEIINSYQYEIEQMDEIERSWEAKVRSIDAWNNSTGTSYRVKCWKCGVWFFSAHNEPGYCQGCATMKEELC